MMSAAPGSKTKHVVVATIGSLGDLHPCLALALELQRRGHRVTIAATEFYREKVEALGLGFHPMRPHLSPGDKDLIKQCEDEVRGVEILFRNIILPHVKDSFDDLLDIARSADVLMAGEIVYAAPLVSEMLKLPWVSIILSPASFLSACDPSVLVNVPGLIHTRKLGRRVYRGLLELGRMGIRHWWEPVRQLRREQGLRIECEPLFRDKFSRDLVLALFSSALARPQPDWPVNTTQPGFVFYDRDGDPAGGDERLEAFLRAGTPPIVFTLGSSAVHNPKDFFAVSAEAAKLVGRRAVLIGADRGESRLPDAIAVPYAPYSEVFPRAAAIVHQGGSGTTGQAMRAGRPMLVVPYGWDQPDNGARIERMGIGLMLSKRRYAPEKAAMALQRLLEEEAFAARAVAVQGQVLAENAIVKACDAIDSLPSRLH